MRDGTRLAARLWLPETAELHPVPVILEYIPYRKRDMTRGRDASMHPYFAGSGFASIRVDLRGSGDSEGVLSDEYLPIELDDGEDVIAWLREQAWCNGRIGMIGISWGGFNGLQIAARRPPGLEAVVSVCSTDDRYADDVHYMGGCLLSDNISWASTMFAYNSMPPDPAIVGEAWREMWMQRLDGSGLWLETWLEHQHRDEYWKHGSVCEDFDAIRCPVMAVSGWADGYSNSVFRLLSGLSAPRLGIIGPWSHTYPHLGTPGPAIGFLQECLRWWDYWLCDRDTGIMDEPMLRAWMLDSVDPATDYRNRPGRWIGEPQWPAESTVWREYCFARGVIVDRSAPESEGTCADGGEQVISSPLSVGLYAGKWCSYASAPDLPSDQREEDGGALVFESDPLSEPIEVLGAPEVELELRSDRPAAMVAVRLSDVGSDGKATRVTYGLLNLTHRNSHETPEPMQPGEWTRVRFSLNYVAQRFAAGRRVRVAISTSYWPLAWPSPEQVCLGIRPAGCRIRLPLRSHDAAYREPAPTFEDAEQTPPPSRTVLRQPEHNWLITRDLGRDSSELHAIGDFGTYRLDGINLEVSRRTDEWYRHTGDDVLSAESEIVSTRGLARDGWRIRTVTRTLLTCSPEEFEIHATLDAYEGAARVFSKTWNTSVPRQLV